MTDWRYSNLSLSNSYEFTVLDKF